MCGISVIINLNNSSVSSKILKKMNDSIFHRGPDDEGFYYGENFGFGFRRLSIIDLSMAGHQPMTDSSHNVLIFNGEIYNYIELRNELESANFRFKSNSDTEVLMASYAYWGDKCVDHFNGMWAFVLFDKKKKILFCSRDRYGIKPFNYTITDQNFLIGSEIKQFIQFDNFKVKLEHSSAYEYLINSRLNTNENTFFEGVKELEAGHNLIYDLKTHKYETRKFYDIENTTINKNISYEDAVKKFYGFFENSVKIRMRSDVAVGSLLSGGLDSSSIVCLIKELNEKVKTISACFEDINYDEQEYIDCVSKYTKFQAIKVFPVMNLLLNDKVLEKIIFHQDQPILSASHFSEFKVFEEAAQQKLTVIMDGQGADEFMAGYLDFNIFFSSLMSNLSLKKLFVELNGYRRKHHHGFLKVVLSFCLFYIKHITYKVKYNKTSVNNKYSFFNKTLELEKVLSKPSRSQNYIFNDIKSISNNYIKKISLPYQLHSEDRNSMAHSVESRLPFLDFELTDFLLSLPDEFKIKDGETKSILRTALQNVLPAKIRNRHKKMGFVAPDESWIRENHVSIRNELKEVLPLLGGIINDNLLLEFDQVIQNKKPYDQIYFRVLSFGLWVKVFNVKI